MVAARHRNRTALQVLLGHAATVVVCLCAWLPSSAFAWNGFGHMVVAATAYEQLTPSVRKKITKLLKLDPDYATWVEGVPANDQDRIAFVMAAMWPDVIKKSPGYTNDGSEPKGPKAAQNIGYADKLQHHYWHYIDVPFSPDGTPLIQPLEPNARTQIAAFRATLRSGTASDDVKSYDLVWLLHLVGDVHQPLHCASRFDKAQLKGDRGGNLVATCSKPKCRAELHALWDDLLGTSKDPNRAIKKAAKLEPPKPELAAVTDESKWIKESFEAAKKHVYVDPPIGVGAGPYETNAEYRKRARKVAAERIALAGVRLAMLLNDALK